MYMIGKEGLWGFAFYDDSTGINIKVTAAILAGASGAEGRFSELKEWVATAWI